MVQLAANLTLMFTEMAFLERFDAAARAGFRAVECQFPYAFDAADIKAALTEAGLAQVLINMPPGDWDAGERGIACHPDRVDEFRDGVTRALDYAHALGCRKIHCLSGLIPAGLDPADARAVYVENLRHAAAQLAPAQMELLIEPINTTDMPGYFLTGTAQALAVITDVGASNIALQYDMYHMHIMEGRLAETLKRHLGAIGHIQIADAPGRHEPGTGEIDFAALLPLLDRIGYTGWVGCEYVPAAGTQDGLGWASAYLTCAKP